MTWTAEEQREIGTALLGSWPGTMTAWGKEAIAAYISELRARGLTAEQTLTAIRTWPAGSDFPPSAPNLAALARQDPSTPTPEEAYRLIYGPRGVMRARPAPGGSYGSEAEMLGARNEARVKRAYELHPMLGAFVERFGVDRLAMLEVDDPDYGELRRRDVREAWERHCEAMQGRDVAALAAGQRRGEMGRFDPLAALGRPRRGELESTTGQE